MSFSSHKKDKKFTWCLSTYGSLLKQCGIKINGVRECQWGCNCNNAHTIDQICIKPEIAKWNTKSKEHIDILKMKENIIQVITVEKIKVKNPKYQSKIQHINDMCLKELFNFWFDITCYHRKIDKSIKNGMKYVEGYTNPYDVPKFYLDNEDDVWSLQRTFNLCESHFNIQNNRYDVFYIKDICVGHFNCKKGVHRHSDLCCMDDLIKGECNCPSSEEIRIEKEKYNNEIIKLQEELNTDDEFTPVISKGREKQIRNRINELNILIKNIKPRLVHYTEQGLIPLNERIKERKKSEPAAIAINISKKKVVKLVK